MRETGKGKIGNTEKVKETMSILQVACCHVRIEVHYHQVFCFS